MADNFADKVLKVFEERFGMNFAKNWDAYDLTVLGASLDEAYKNQVFEDELHTPTDCYHDDCHCNCCDCQH